MERIEISIIPKKLSQRLTVYEIGVHNWNEHMTQEQIDFILEKTKEKFTEELSKSIEK